MKKKKSKVLIGVCLAVACAFPCVAYAAGSGVMHFGSLSTHNYSDVSYKMRSGICAQTNGWVDAYGWTKPSRTVGPGAVECYTRLLDGNLNYELNWGWDVNSDYSQLADVALEVHANYYEGSSSRSYNVVSEHRVRDPETLNIDKYHTYVGLM